ncbi:hypothetical protein R1sor_004223 [Riccia sorocarpa]|uniref:Uncharacterized protein n=1 Tax=Riccia sorocarpa TaxID=122646 RepID=A0ABD3H7V7_9MARC
MEAREGVDNSQLWQETDDFSQEQDFYSQMANPILSIPSSQVRMQVNSRVVRPRVAPFDPHQLASWARRAHTQPLPRTPPSLADGEPSSSDVNLDGRAFGSSFDGVPRMRTTLFGSPVHMVGSAPVAVDPQPSQHVNIKAPIPAPAPAAQNADFIPPPPPPPAVLISEDGDLALLLLMCEVVIMTHTMLDFGDSGTTDVTIDFSQTPVHGVSQLRVGDSGQEVRSALAEYLALAT